MCGERAMIATGVAAWEQVNFALDAERHWIKDSCSRTRKSTVCEFVNIISSCDVGILAGHCR